MDQVYNLKQLEELAGGSSEFVDSMVETYLEHTPQQINQMAQAYEAGDLEEVGGIAHKIKPNVDLFGISAIRDEIRIVEQKGKSGIDDDEMRQSFEKVKQYLEISFEQLKQR